MDIVKLLTQDHAEVNKLFGRFGRSSRPETLKRLAKEIIHELSVHAAVEEQFVYPVLRWKAEGGNDLAQHAIDEHQEVKRLLADLERMDPANAEFRAKMDQVVRAVREHVSDEEGDVLPRLKATTDADLRETLGTLVEGAKSVVPTHPHPLVPGTATAQLIAGPWAGIVDRIRDLVA